METGPPEVQFICWRQMTKATWYRLGFTALRRHVFAALLLSQSKSFWKQFYKDEGIWSGSYISQISWNHWISIHHFYRGSAGNFRAHYSSCPRKGKGTMKCFLLLGKEKNCSFRNLSMDISSFIHHCPGSDRSLLFGYLKMLDQLSQAILCVLTSLLRSDPVLQPHPSAELFPFLEERPRTIVSPFFLKQREKQKGISWSRQG